MSDTIKDFFVNLWDTITGSDYYIWIIGIAIVLVLVLLWVSMNKLNKEKQ